MRGIRIPGADISFGVFDSTRFQGADLRQVDLRGAWLQNIDFTGAQMTGTQFGELPYLELGYSSKICQFSPDERTVSIGLFKSTINTYSASTWEKLWTLDAHAERILSLAYSPTGSQVVSCGSDTTIRLWDMDTGA
ncbi:hypothetical protein B0O80DRAFT_463428 [Mortierella sp. GBAus27b]|nr:hypothetical protein B0O80DRAFT_463428 [Mortierella sp. GBAus27b]